MNKNSRRLAALFQDRAKGLTGVPLMENSVMLASSKPTVMLLVASTADYQRYVLALQGSFQVERLALNAETPFMIQRARPDVVVMDYEDKALPPLQLAYQLRVHPNPKTYTAIVCVGAAASEEIEAQGVEVFCSREQAHTKIRALVKNALRIRATLEEMSAINRQQNHVSERLKRLSLTDDLTGLFNMRFMAPQLQNEFLRAERYQKSLSLLLIDVDHFRSFSQQRTAVQASQILTQIGQDIGDGVRFEIDYAARSGLDEFLLVLPETKLAGALIVAERLRLHIAESHYLDAQSTARLTVSVGITHYDGSNREIRRSHDLLRLLEISLQQAKEEGRNRIGAPTGSPQPLAPSA